MSPGEFTGSGENSAEQGAAQNRAAVVNKETETDVPDIKANGEKDGIPVFDVNDQDFYNNMKVDRKRMRFTTDGVKDYMQRTKYNRPFYIRNRDNYLRKVKS
jgi:alkylated DNA repair dioxygenase AlkB